MNFLFLNLLPNKKFMDWFKLKACASDSLKVAQMMKILLDCAENNVGKAENDCTLSRNV